MLAGLAGGQLLADDMVQQEALLGLVGVRPQKRVPGQEPKRGKWQAYVAGKFRLKSG